MIAEFQERLENILSHLPQWRRERSVRIRQLSREMMLSTVEHMLNELRRIYSELPDVLVTNDNESGAPIISEDNPTYSNLLGRVEHIAQFGALVTDFMLIKPGASQILTFSTRA